MDGTFDQFTERARKVLSLAQDEALRFNHNYIGTEHLLLGLTREYDSAGARVLGNLGVELNKVRATVEFVIGRGDRIVLGDIGLTPRAKKVIELAVDEARRLGHRTIGTEHLLLGMVREGEGVAAGVLESHGVNLEKVRAETVATLNASPPYISVSRDHDPFEARLAQRLARAQASLSPAVEPRARLVNVLTLVCRDVDATAAFYLDFLDATELDFSTLDTHAATGAERLLGLPYGVPLLALRSAVEGADEVEKDGVGGVELSVFTGDGDALWAALQARDAPRVSPISTVPNAPDAKMFTLTDPDGRRLRVYGQFGG